MRIGLASTTRECLYGRKYCFAVCSVNGDLATFVIPVATMLYSYRVATMLYSYRVATMAYRYRVATMLRGIKCPLWR